jgi:hypothetical protein
MRTEILQEAEDELDESISGFTFPLSLSVVSATFQL